MKIDYQNITLFKELDNRTLQTIDRALTLNQFGKDTVIHFEDERCDYIEIITKGAIQIEQWNQKGEIKLIREYHKNDVFGMNVIFSSEPVYFMNVITTEETDIYRIHRDTLENLIDISSLFRMSFIQLLSDNTAKIGLKIKSDFKQSLRDKIKQFLIEKRIINGSDKIVLTMSKTQLAYHFGCERTSLSRELQKMREDKLILFDRNSITILF